MRLPFQFLTLAALLTLVPWLGYQYIEEMSSRLVQSQQQRLDVIASSVTRALEESPPALAGLPVPAEIAPG
ncbi:MAG: hypothetical protein HUJ31_13330, partial [Pseudomonadales bacterium]|nr:hypothetical protein [Pseudomonadales bacterium]